MNRKDKTKTPTPVPHGHPGTDAGAFAGELVGAVVGSAAGPVGTVAGMVVGAVVGALTGHVLEDESRRHRTHDEELDEAIGVTGGDLGVAGAAAAHSPESDLSSERNFLDEDAPLEVDEKA